MKSLIELINERLKLTKDSKIETAKLNQLGYDESILDVNIKDLNHLKEILKEYFKPYVQKDGYMLHIPKFCYKHRLAYNGFGYDCSDIFVINFCKISKGPIRKLYVGQTKYGNGEIIMQIHKKNMMTKHSFVECKLVGKYDKLNIGDNLLHWLDIVKEHTINNEVGNEINLMETFFGELNRKY